MYLLDTEVVSELRRNQSHPTALAWLSSVASEHLYLSSVTVGEIQTGIEIARVKDAPRAAALEAWLDELTGTHRVLPMDSAVFRVWGKLLHRRWDVRMTDAMIAATAVVHRLTVVTGEPEVFDQLGVQTLNPFEK